MTMKSALTVDPDLRINNNPNSDNGDVTDQS